MPDENLMLLKKLSGGLTIIVGIGNLLKGDDAVGPLVCRRLKRQGIDALLFDAGTVPENYIYKIIDKAPQNLIVIDAMDFCAPAGTIKVFRTEQLTADAISTHTLSPAIFVDMIRSCIQTDVYFIGIQPLHLRLGEPVSKEIHRAIKQLCRSLLGIFGRSKQKAD
jgi:hydrogenase maturation protease